MKVSKENSANKLVDSLLGKAKPPTNLPPLKYGKDMEPLAVKDFIKYFKKHHKDVRYRQCGIFIDKKKKTVLGSIPRPTDRVLVFWGSSSRDHEPFQHCQ